MSGPAASAVVRAGGIVPTGREGQHRRARGRGGTRRYAHPALPGPHDRTDHPGCDEPGADVEMETLGFARGEVSGKLGRGASGPRVPGLGACPRPGAREVRARGHEGLRGAAKQVKSSSATRATRSSRSESSSPAPYLTSSPSFWEEAGRRFVAEDSTTFAAGRPSRRRGRPRRSTRSPWTRTRSAVYPSSRSRARSPRSRSRAMRRSSRKRTAQRPRTRATSSFIATWRVLGGMPPWTGLAKEPAPSRKRQKDVAAEGRRVPRRDPRRARDSRAPGELWDHVRARDRAARAAVALVRRRPATSTRKAAVPREGPPARGGSICSCAPARSRGLWDESVDVAGGGYAGRHRRSGSKGDPLHEGCAGPSTSCRSSAPVREAKPVAVVYMRRRRGGRASPLDPATVAAGAPIAEPPRWCSIDLAERSRDPVHVEADAVLGRACPRHRGRARNPEFEARILGKKGLARVRRAWLEREVGRLEGPPRRARLRLRASASEGAPDALAEHPDPSSACRAPTGVRVTRTLRGGVFAEWTWLYEEPAGARRSS